MVLTSPEDQIRSELSKSKTIPLVVKTAIEKRFGRDLRRYFRIPEENGNASPVYQALYAKAFDYGLSKVRSYTDTEGKGMLHVAKPVAMLKRSAAVNEIKSQIFTPEGTYNQKQLKILSLDVALFSRANELSQTAGNYLANKTASALQEAIRETQSKFIINQGEFQCIDFRYGGDELMVALLGTMPQGFEEALQQAIEQKLMQTYAFFKDADDHERKLPIRLKKGVEVIETPTDAYEQKIFLTYLERGIVMDNEEISKIIMSLSKDGHVDEDLYQRFLNVSSAKKPIYPEGVEGTEKKVDLIAAIHPEYAPALWFAQQQDNSEGNADIAQKAILEFVENALYNNLFRTNVISFDDLTEHLEKRLILDKPGYDISNPESSDRYFAISFNFLKDLNDTFNIAIGDLALEALSKEIELEFSAVEDAFILDRKQTDLAQRGGTLIFRINRHKLTDENYAKFKNLHSITFTSFDNKQITLPVGVREHRVEYGFRDQSEKEKGPRAWAGKELGEIINGSDDSFYLQLLSLMEEQGLLARLDELSEQTVEGFNAFLNNNKDFVQSTMFLRHFITPKTARNRIKRALRAITNSKTSVIRQTEKWEQVLQRISDKCLTYEREQIKNQFDLASANLYPS